MRYYTMKETGESLGSISMLGGNLYDMPKLDIGHKAVKNELMKILNNR